jgi:anhydro-N-acetylmuramic acid kinase
MTERPLIAIGLMSGTSADGIDAALIETDGHGVQATGGFLTLPMPPGLRAEILAATRDPVRCEDDPLADLERAITNAHAEAVQGLLAQAGVPAAAIDVIGFHGQTVLHRPERRLTRQLGDGARLAAAMGIAVVNRFRDADVASGGQGAPLVPLFHQALARDLAQPVAVLNIGGVANVTYIDGETLLAFDTGPGNALIDDWVHDHTGQRFDADGAFAAAGTVDAVLLSALLAHRYFRAVPPKSLDRNDFAETGLAGLSLQDGAATLAEFTAQSVARAREHVPCPPRRWLIGGGGRHNAALMGRLRAVLGVSVEPVEAVGWNGDALEAQAFGFLAVRSLRGLPLSVPSTTGVPYPMPGGIVHR